MRGEGKLLILIGLPGSGKTHFTKRFEGKEDVVVFDDYMKESIDSSSKLANSQYHGKVINALRQGKTCVISDIQLCRRSKRQQLFDLIASQPGGVKVECVFFENVPEKCIANAIRRNNKDLKDEIQTIRNLSGRYNIPEGMLPVPVYGVA